MVASTPTNSERVFLKRSCLGHLEAYEDAPKVEIAQVNIISTAEEGEFERTLSSLNISPDLTTEQKKNRLQFYDKNDKCSPPKIGLMVTQSLRHTKLTREARFLLSPSLGAHLGKVGN